MSFWRKLLGARGEDVACRFLKRAGYRILHRNYACPAGELDIVALDKNTIVFVEVKTRRDDEQAEPVDSITTHKRGQIVKAARHWLTAHGYPARAYRIDAVSVIHGGSGRPKVSHVVEAFVPDE